MKTFRLLLFLPVLLFACKPAAEKQPEVNPVAPPSATQADSITVENLPDTTVQRVIQAEAAKKEFPKSTPHITEHVCHPAFTVLAKPVKTTHFYYVSGFDPREFKCWEELTVQATQLAQDQMCTIYYLDDPGIKVSASPPNYIDAAALKTHGIGKFEHNGKYWEIKGASQWKRADKGYDYFNTSNQYGG